MNLVQFLVLWQELLHKFLPLLYSLMYVKHLILVYENDF